MKSVYFLALVIVVVSVVYSHAAPLTSPEDDLAVPQFRNDDLEGQLVRNKRAPLGKLALLGGAALVGKKALLLGGAAVGAKALIGAGVVGAGLYKAKYYGGGYGGGYGGSYGGSYGGGYGGGYSAGYSSHGYGWGR